MTLYELIGRIKDGKAPERVELFDETFKYDKELKDYQDSDGDWLFQDYDWQSDLDTKLDNYIDYVVTITNSNFTVTPAPRKEIEKLVKQGFTRNQKKIADKINELIDEVNYINKNLK